MESGAPSETRQLGFNVPDRSWTPVPTDTNGKRLGSFVYLVSEGVNAPGIMFGKVGPTRGLNP